MAKEQLFESYLATASSLVQQYDGSIPLNDFQKQYFSLHKKFGSRDRKYITHLCYCFYRLGYVSQVYNNEIKEKILFSLFLCSQKQNELLAQLKPEWNEKAALSLEEKTSFLSIPFTVTDIFPWKDELSGNIKPASFAASHLIQPDLFLRIRPNKKQQVLKKLQVNNIVFSECADDCLALSVTTKVDNVLQINKEVVIQDYSSQKIQEFLKIIKSDISHQTSVIKVWDCCAASGGKSILAADLFKNIDLTASDVRPSIMHNLKRRFREASIKNFNTEILDLTHSITKDLLSKSSEGFYLIICDTPCTGSGTWSRTPEQLFFFEKEKINYYADLQRKIVSNTIPHLTRKGYFLYITCSVFKKENEEVVEFIQKKFNLQLIKQEVLIGYDKKADTMFGALFKHITSLS